MLLHGHLLHHHPQHGTLRIGRPSATSLPANNSRAELRAPRDYNFAHGVFLCYTTGASHSNVSTETSTSAGTAASAVETLASASSGSLWTGLTTSREMCENVAGERPQFEGKAFQNTIFPTLAQCMGGSWGNTAIHARPIEKAKATAFVQRKRSFHTQQAATALLPHTLFVQQSHLASPNGAKRSVQPLTLQQSVTDMLKTSPVLGLATRFEVYWPQSTPRSEASIWITLKRIQPISAGRQVHRLFFKSGQHVKNFSAQALSCGLCRGQAEKHSLFMDHLSNNMPPQQCFIENKIPSLLLSFHPSHGPTQCSTQSPEAQTLAVSKSAPQRQVFQPGILLSWNLCEVVSTAENKTALKTV